VSVCGIESCEGRFGEAAGGMEMEQLSATVGERKRSPFLEIDWVLSQFGGSQVRPRGRIGDMCWKGSKESRRGNR